MKKMGLWVLLLGMLFLQDSKAGNQCKIMGLDDGEVSRSHYGRPLTPPIYTEEKPDISFKPQPVSKLLPTSLTPDFMVQMGFPTHDLMYTLFLEGEDARQAEGRVIYYELPAYIGWLQVTYCRVFDLPKRDFSVNPTDSFDMVLQSTRGLKPSTATPYQVVTDVIGDISHNPGFLTSCSHKEPGTDLTQVVYYLTHKNHLILMIGRRMRLEEGKSFPNHAQYAPSLHPTYGNFKLVEEKERR